MTTGRTLPTARFATVVGVVVIGLSIGLAAFVSAIRRDLGPPDLVPRGIALGAPYATAGIVAVLGARRHRPGLVTAAGVILFVGAFLSIATIAFLIPAALLIGIGLRGSRSSGDRTSARSMVMGFLSSGSVAILTLLAAVALLGQTETRCWVATGTQANPVYEILAPGEPLSAVGGPNNNAFASGCDGGALTLQGVAAEAVLLAGAIWWAGGGPLPRRRDRLGLPPQPA